MPQATPRTGPKQSAHRSDNSLHQHAAFVSAAAAAAFWGD